MLHKQTQEDIQTCDAPEVFGSHEWTFVEERASLDAASRAQLRNRFNEWAAQAVTVEQPEMLTDNRHVASVHGVPRYNYFIQIDEEALRSMLDRSEDSYLEPRFVNFVDSRWKTFGRDSLEDVDDDEQFDSIDGCTEENVGWMRVAPSRLDEEFYMMDEVAWYVYYLRPPDVLRY